MFVTPETDRRGGVHIFNASPGPNPNLNLLEATKENLGEFLNAFVTQELFEQSSGLKDSVYSRIMDTSSAAANIDVARTLRRGVQETLTKPKIVTTYSKGMKGVDQRDASLYLYNLEQKIV